MRSIISSSFKLRILKIQRLESVNILLDTLYIKFKGTAHQLRLITNCPIPSLYTSTFNNSGASIINYLDLHDLDDLSSRRFHLVEKKLIVIILELVIRESGWFSYLISSLEETGVIDNVQTYLD